MNKPQISVVMGVYNEQGCLKHSIESVLSQQGVTLELLVINDGSTDRSERIIQKYCEADSRVTLINQNNFGLTQSLINGCRHAKGEYIARQDAGDISLPGRLEAQLKAFKHDKSLALVSTGTVFIAPDGEPFNPTIQSRHDASEGLKQWTLESLKGPPHHGSVMFRRDIYNQVNGYREPFLVAQDIDLWTRMIAFGGHHSLPTIYYEAKADQGSISHLQRDAQLQTAQIIFKCCHAREQYGTDQSVIDEMIMPVKDNNHKEENPTQPNDKSASNNTRESEFFYFIASSLRQSNRRASNKYFKRALRAKPTNWKALAKWIVS